MSITIQSIQDVLALLPKIFPGTQEVPLDRIRPNPKNPGPPIPEALIADLAANLEGSELLNPIKLMPDPAKPLADGVEPQPENPKLRSDGQPWGLSDFNWVILSGERRFRAFGRLKRGFIPAYILNPTPKEAVKITRFDNDVRDRGWWADYQSIEQLIEADPNLTQRQVAVELKMDHPKVNRALRLLPLLNPEARALIGSDATNSNKGKKGISELAASELAGLGPETGLKPGVKAAGEDAQKLWPYPAIPPETQGLVLRALKVALDQEMTQAQVKRLVEWVKGGNDPESFWVTQTGKSPKDFKKPQAKASPKSGSKGAKGASGFVQPLLASMAHQTLQHLKARVGSKLKKWVVWAVVCGVVGLVLNYLLPPLVNAYIAVHFHQDLTPQAQNVNQVPPVTSQAPNALKSSPRAGEGRGEGEVGRGRGTGKSVVKASKPHAQPEVVQAPVQPALAPATKGPGHLPTGPQAGGQAMVVPSRGAEGNGGTKVGSAPLWATADANYASDFAAHFFRISYVNWPSTLDYFKGRVDKDYFPDFQNQYFPPTLKGQMEEKRLVQTFWPTGTPKLLKWEGMSDEYLVRGTHSLENHYNEPPQTLSKETAGVVVQVVHDIDTGKRIVKVSLATPEQMAAASQSDDTTKGTDLGNGSTPSGRSPQGSLEKQIGDGVKDLNDAVNKADQGASDVGKVKNLLGVQ